MRFFAALRMTFSGVPLMTNALRVQKGVICRRKNSDVPKSACNDCSCNLHRMSKPDFRVFPRPGHSLEEWLNCLVSMTIWTTYARNHTTARLLRCLTGRLGAFESACIVG